MDNRRSTVVINGQFQYQYALLAVVFSVLLVNLFLIINAILPGSQGYPLSTEYTVLVVCLEILLIGGVWWGGLITSNKIAGPVYVIVRQLEKLAEGDLTARVHLRKKDAFKFEAVAINQCIEELQDHLLEVKKVAKELESSSGDNAETNKVLIAQLNQKISQFNL